MFTSRAVLFHLLCSLHFCAGYHKFETYHPYPEDALGLLNQTAHDLAEKSPKVEILITLPGQDFFTHLQEVAIRNTYQNPIFHLDVNYFMVDGLEMGCRKANGDHNGPGRNKDHSPSGEHPWICDHHCTHKGRYCPAFSHDYLMNQTGHHNGGEVTMEVLRRLCMGEVLPHGFSDPLWFEYLQGFQESNCMGKGQNLTKCSHQAMVSKMANFRNGPNSPFAKCVKVAEADTDTPNAMLERSLDFTHEHQQYSVNQLPILLIDGRRITGQPRADHILHDWCSLFPGEERPVACDFCLGCNNAKNCLWQLSCDKHPFDINTYKDAKHPNKHNGANNNNAHADNTVATEMETVGEDVAVGTGAVLAGGIAIGLVVAAFLWCMVELKRRKAVAEVAKELPEDGFKDTGSNGGDSADTDVELPEVS